MKKYVLMLALAAPLTAAAQYTIIDLGTLGGGGAGAQGISSSGHVVGRANITSGDTHAFLWRDGEMTDLGVLGSLVLSFALGVNVFDHVVGVSTNRSGELRRAFLWVDGDMTGLGTFGGRNSTARSINDSDQIAGVAETSAEVSRAFLWESGTMSDLGTLPGGMHSAANGINSLSQVVGSSNVDGNRVSRPFLWENGAMIDLGTLGGERGGAWAINDAAQVVGRSEISPGGARHAFLWEDGTMTDLGTLGDDSFAHDINAAGEVVGTSAERAFLWRGGAMTDLNDLLPPGSGWELLYATEINDAGQIVGQGVLDGRFRAYRMTPVPEPGTFAVLSVALLALVRRRRT